MSRLVDCPDCWDGRIEYVTQGGTDTFHLCARCDGEGVIEDEDECALLDESAAKEGV